MRCYWAREFGVPAFAVEGCGSYGAGLARFLELGVLLFGSVSGHVAGIGVVVRVI